MGWFGWFEQFGQLGLFGWFCMARVVWAVRLVRLVWVVWVNFWVWAWVAFVWLGGLGGFRASVIRRRGTFCKAEDSTLPRPMSLLTNKINSSWLQI